MEGAASDSDVPPSISQSWSDGDHAKAPDGISAVPQTLGLSTQAAISLICLPK